MKTLALLVLVVGAAHGAAGRRSEGTKDGDVVSFLIHPNDNDVLGLSIRYFF
jgi:hypothetical protein